VCLLTAKPASLLPLLADDLGEVPRRSHGCNKERSGATSFESDSSLRIPWDEPTFLLQKTAACGGVHGADEWVDLESVRKATEIYALTIMDYLM